MLDYGESRCGVSVLRLSSMWFVAGSLLRDLAAAPDKMAEPSRLRVR